MKEILVFLSGALTAIFAEQIRRYLFRARVVLEFGLTSDFLAEHAEICKNEGGESSRRKLIFVRGRVRNKSTNIAKHCIVYLTNIEKRSKKTGRFEQTNYGDNIPFRWSCSNGDDIDIPQGIDHYFSIIRLREKDEELEPQLKQYPFRYKEIFTTPGEYRYTIQVVGEGFSPVKKRIIFDWRGDISDFVIKQS